MKIKEMEKDGEAIFTLSKVRNHICNQDLAT